MSENGSYPASITPRLSSSTSSLSLSSAKQISQVYKHSSQLFLTRRIQEALSTIESVITPPSSQYDQQGDVAPIATASSNLRIKVWNLYISILNAIVELGPEEGRKQFGHKEWKALASKVRDGELWDMISQVGYQGRDGSIDADVVYNIATLLLTHSPSQKLNQQRLETYLSSYSQPDLDISTHLQNSSPGKRKHGANGTDTPKDLSARVRILELFTLHVLPRNDEWEYAKEFVNLSEVLDEERKEAFLQTLDNLREEKERGTQRAAELQREKEAELERQRQREEQRKLAEQQKAAAAAEKSLTAGKAMNGHRRTSSEVDYGIEKGNPNLSSSKTRNLKPATKSGRGSASATASGGTPLGRSTESSKQVKKAAGSKSNVVVRQMRMLSNLLVMIVKNLGRSLSSSPLSFLRTLLIVIGAVMALSRADVRERIRRVTNSGWQKIRGTVGMGVKVSYI